MNLRFGPKGTLIIDDARIIWRNFSGEKSQYNMSGKREFNLVIPNQEIADMLLADTNEYGNSWNVKMKPPMDEDGDPLLYLKVGVKFNQYGPPIYVVSNGVQREISEEEVGMLDRMAIEKVDLDIRPYDWVTMEGTKNEKRGRAAYLQSIKVYQKEIVYDRFAVRDEDEDRF